MRKLIFLVTVRFISITYNKPRFIYSMIAPLTVPDFILILLPTAEVDVEVIHDNSLECISPTTACVKLLFI